MRGFQMRVSFQLREPVPLGSGTAVPHPPHPKLRMLDRLIRQRWFWWSLFAAWWVFFTATFTVSGYYSRAAAGEDSLWSAVLLVAMAHAATWAVIAFAAFQLAWRLPLENGRWRWSVPLHLAAALLLLAGRAVVYHLLAGHVAWMPDVPLSTRLQSVPVNVVWYSSFLGAGYAIAFYRRFREGELRTLQLEAGLARTQLQVVRMQLQPHFLFTTLAGISELMHRDVPAADRMLARLGDLLRLMLERRGTEEVSLREELEFIGLYLEIERMRLGPDRLQVESSIAPDTLDALVPHLILQPLVENAVRVGLSGCPEAARVEIAAKRHDDRLEIEVRERCGARLSSGRPPVSSAPELSTARARLAQLYNGGHRLDLQPSPWGGQVIRMTIPFHSLPASGALAGS